MTSTIAKPFRFYSHNKAKEGWMFSNFSDHPITINGEKWSTSEHFFQAMKFKETDDDWYEEIKSAPTPDEAKKMGNSRLHFMRNDWNKTKDEVMFWAISSKFNQHGDIKEALFKLRNREIIEASTKDFYWGEGSDGHGKNKIGRAHV